MRNKSQPWDGYGGDLYDTPFVFPSYMGYEFNVTTRQLDAYTHAVSKVTCVEAVCFGLCLMTLFQILALTPSSKRGLPLFNFIIGGLLAELMRELVVILDLTVYGHSSMYWLITFDLPTTHLSYGTYALTDLANVLPVVAFFFVQLAFWTQAKAVLVTLHMARPWLYYAVISYLIALGTFTFIWRAVYAAYDSVYVHTLVLPPAFFELSTLYLYVACIGSWSLVFTISVIHILWKRRKIIPNSSTNDAINILIMTGLESMLIPIFFCILEVFSISWFLEPEDCVLPSVLIVMPFGSLWASTVRDQHPGSTLYMEDLGACRHRDGCDCIRRGRGNNSLAATGSTVVPSAATTATGPADAANSHTTLVNPNASQAASSTSETHQARDADWSLMDAIHDSQADFQHVRVGNLRPRGGVPAVSSTGPSSGRALRADSDTTISGAAQHYPAERV